MVYNDKRKEYHEQDSQCDQEKRKMNDSQQMDTLLWLGPSTMNMQRVAIPTLKAGEVLIEVSTAGICGSELSGYLGHNSLRKPPLIMGHEAAGHVVQTTEGTFADGNLVREGARVTFNPLISCGECDRCRANRANLCRKRQIIGIHRAGAFAQFVAVPAKQCYLLPDALSESIAALTEPLACAVRAVSLTRARSEDTLLILGAGPIGLFCLAAAQAMGVEHVLITDMAPARLAVAERWGATSVINARESDVVAEINRLIPGGVNAVIDAVGASVTRKQAVEAVTPGGQVVYIGLHDEESLLAANYVVRQEVAITGSFAYTPEDFKRAFYFLVQGLLHADPSWLEERPLAAGAGAFEELIAGTAPATKIILRMA